MDLGPVTNVYLKNLSPLTEYTVAVFALYDAGQSEALSGGFNTSKTVWSLPMNCLKMFKWVNSVILFFGCVKDASICWAVGVDLSKLFFQAQKRQDPLVFIIMSTAKTNLIYLQQYWFNMYMYVHILSYFPPPTEFTIFAAHRVCNLLQLESRIGCFLCPGQSITF